MSFIINPYVFGGAAVDNFGALVRKSGAQSVSTVLEALTWETELYDATGWHSTSSNTERMTVPAGVSLVRITTNVTSGTVAPLIQHFKNGAVVRGGGKADTANSGNHYVNIASAPLAVSASDWFDTGAILASSNDITNDEETWFSIEKLDAATKYAIVYHNASQALSAATFTVLANNSEVVDTDGFHDTVTNNSRLTVPSGVTLVRLSGNLAGGNVTLQFFGAILKNGAAARGLPARDCDTASEENVNLISAPLVVTTGDYFELQAFASTATSVPSAENVWFAIEEVPSTIKRALVHKSGGTQSFTANVAAAVTWDAEVYDTDSIHDNVTNNNRLTVPAGCTKARPSFSLKASSGPARMQAWVGKSGSDYFGMPVFSTNTTGSVNLSATGAWVDVSPGDYFSLAFISDANCTLGTDNETWFCLECQ